LRPGRHRGQLPAGRGGPGGPARRPQGPVLPGGRPAPGDLPMTGQPPPPVVPVRPHHSRPNPQTPPATPCQHALDAPAEQSARRAAAEVDGLAEVIAAAGVGVTVVDDEGIATPDSVFPNNWLSTHADGTLALYPMYAPNRRAERRDDVIERLRERFVVRRVADFSGEERRGRFLEGTGAMVLDHVMGV